MNPPLISVVMSVYNTEKYLRYSIESILNQTFRDFEFIILDDGSTDNSLKIIEEYQVKDGRILLIKNKNNIGLAASLNKGIKLAKSKYIARQDADDISNIDRLTIQYNFMEKNKNIDILGSNCSYIDLHNRHIFNYDKFSKNNSYEETLLSQQAIFPHGVAFIRSTTITMLNGYNENFYYSQDGELWLRAIKNNYTILVLSSFLYKYRLCPVSGKAKYGHRQYNKIKNEMYSNFISDNKIKNLNPVSMKVKNDIMKYNNKENDDTLSDYWVNIAKLFILKSKNKKYVFTSLIYSLKSTGNVNNLFKIIILIAIGAIPSIIIEKLNFIKNNFSK